MLVKLIEVFKPDGERVHLDEIHVSPDAVKMIRKETNVNMINEAHSLGIVNNADNLVNDYLPDYDIDDKGRRFSGQDLALICYCASANAQYDIDGQIISHGFRDLDGNIRNNVGVDIPMDAVREIHNKRKESWKQSEKLMNKLIQKNIKSQKASLPPEVQKVKDQLANFKIKSL